MIDVHTVKTIHFTGIKGVGMTALACIAKDFGMRVSGSDTDEVFVTDETLKAKGILWQVGFSEERIREIHPDMVVFTAAHQGEQNLEVRAAQMLGIPVLTLGETLGLFQQTKIGISVVGVGGKTTTSAMLATVLEKAGVHPSYMIGVGGIPSLDFCGRYDYRGTLFVAEADEYACSPLNKRPKFYYQSPQVILLTNLAFDHPDIYENEEATLTTFAEFINKLPPNGLLIANSDSPLVQKLLQRVSVPTITYGENSQADWVLTNYEVGHGQAVCRISNNQESASLTIKIPGIFNAKNAVATWLCARFYEIPAEQIQKGLSAFTGTRRRFEKIAEIQSTLLYDDYAHHPEEIKTTLTAAKQWFPGKKRIVIFQPHTFSRTKMLFSDFSHSFQDADLAIIPDIYASAREQNDPTISSKMLVEAINKQGAHAVYQPDKNKVLDYLRGMKLDDSVIVTMGAGDVYKWQSEIAALIS